MDSQKFVNLIFPTERSTYTRRVDVAHILKVAPKCCVGMFFSDSSSCLEEIIINEYSADDWDICLSIAEGITNLYEHPSNIVNIYDKYFGGGALDTVRNSMIIDIGSSLTDINKLILNDKPGIVCVSENIYQMTKEVANSNGLIPFQIVTVNDIGHVICFDHGIPIEYSDMDLQVSRRNLIIALQNSAEHNKYLQPLYKDKYKNIMQNYQKPDEYTFGCRGLEGKRGPVGPVGKRGPVGPVGNTGNIDPRTPCSVHCINSSWCPEEHINTRCICMAYNFSKDGCRDFYLETLIDLSSLDEVKFIKAVANVMISKNTSKLVDKIPKIKCPRFINDYHNARQVISGVDLWPDEKSIFTTVLNGSSYACLKVYLGFVKI